MTRAAIFSTESAKISDLKPHPRNYRVHPADQLAHIIESIREHGFYRNVVIARDLTILAGHGVVLAAREMGHSTVPVIRLDLAPDEPRALKVLAADNELGHLAEVDDRALSELLKEIKDFDLDGLLGTGYDEAMLATLAMVTRPASEIQGFDEAAAWVGMPSYEPADEPIKIIVSFLNEQDRAEFAQRLGLHLTPKTRSTWYPPQERDDQASVKFEPIDA